MTASAAAKDAELYMRRCKQLEAQHAVLLAALEAYPTENDMTGERRYEWLETRRAAIAKAKGDESV